MFCLVHCGVEMLALYRFVSANRGRVRLLDGVAAAVAEGATNVHAYQLLNEPRRSSGSRG